MLVTNRLRLHRPVGVHKTRVDIDVFADARLIFAAPASGGLAAGFVKGAGKMMDSFKADLCGYLLKGVVRILNELLGLLNPILQQIAAR